MQAINNLSLPSGTFMFASADLGRPKWYGSSYYLSKSRFFIRVEAFANAYGTDIAFVRKSRKFTETVVENVIGEVNGKHVIIYDDMTRSGGTLMHAADAYMTRGALSVTAVISHLALTGPNIVEKLRKV